MATIHDVMPAFELFQPASIDDAVSLLQRHRRSVWALAGGLDTFDWLKDRN
ncbi:MAG: xanthine dehydrogenase family protein subunit M, partial [Acidobacteria bacterium]